MNQSFLGRKLFVVGLLILLAQAQKQEKHRIKHRSCSELKGFTDVGGSCYAAISLMASFTAGRSACKLLHPDADLGSLRCDVESRGAWALTNGALKTHCARLTDWQKTMWLGFYNQNSQFTPNTWLNGVNSSYRNWAHGPLFRDQDVGSLYFGDFVAPGRWKHIYSGNRVCAALCEVIVENSGKGCGVGPYGQSRRRGSHDEDRSFARRRRPSHSHSSESDSHENYEGKRIHDRF